ncbi:MAG TPA: FkbM family methyltransferase [Ferruginibacter sp.]|nr:FkbM family methyltransferase [Ferruginibacter sp.]
MGIKKYIHQFTRSLGFDFYALKDKSDGELLRLRWLKEMNIKTVIDIGANEGQFASIIRKLLPESTIYSFEPIPHCYEKLKKNFSNDNRFKAFNMACGDEDAEIEMNINNFSPSSSLLEVNDLHVKNFKHTAASKKQLIPVKKLDGLQSELPLIKPYLVKIDTQGYEDKVIKGGADIIANAQVVFIELTYKPLYKGQTLFDGIYHEMLQLGFQYHGNTEELLSPVNGAVLQTDGVFIKNSITPGKS